jgi:tetratricopeptide (TPR) repeat protein
MATVSLQTVFDEARRAIEAGAADKAIGIAQHILAHFPRMIEGYRLLGEAHLNAGQAEPAAAAFERVLQADPENVAAYYGLGLARQHLDQRAAAITAFERALEIQPNLADLRSQLMRLYAETPGSAGQFRLSRAGLGRLYARGGMFGQAIDEFRAVLDSDSSRDDVKAALAEALWRDGQEDEALEFCRDVLERQPDLLKPNVLLGYLLFASGQPQGETLWRRAAEQDATMTMARSLFDILPPIRLEEPVLPEFDEAEWRAKEARRSADQPVQATASAFASSTEDDFFADSWLSSAGSAVAPAATARIYDDLNARSAGSSPANGSHDDDDDLLASLLGFSSAEPAPAPVVSNDRDQVQPFGFDWDQQIGSGSQSTSETLPSSLDDVGLHDSEVPGRAAQDVGAVQPFSFDDWNLDEDFSSAKTQPAPEPEAELDFPDISAFSLDDDSSTRGGVQPFSFEAETSSDVQPFSLDDDLGDFGGVAPFSFEEEGRTPSTGSAPAPADAGLGNVQPFSLDDWGLDDATGSNLKPLSSDELTGADEQGDFGAFKPFSLDELSLDTLDDDAGSGLSGPQVGNEEPEIEEPSGFSWQEPSWRAQASQSERVESTEGDSIFAKLMRSRSADQQSSPVPEPAQPAASHDEPAETMNFFSLDDEPLRLDESNDQDRWFSDAAITASEQPASPEQSTQPSSTEPEADAGNFFSLEGLEAEQGFSWETSASTQQPDQTAAPDSGNFFSLADLESEQGFSWETGAANQSAESAEQSTEPFSLSDLGLSDDELSALDVPSDASVASGNEQEADTLPFSLSELGLSDDEISALNLQDDQSESMPAGEQSEQPVLPEDMRSDLGAAAQPAEEPEADMTPFSLADLGLNDDELAFFEQAQAERTQAEATPAQPDATQPAEAAEADMTPFSLADLGLNDDELAFFEQAQAGQDLDTASQQTSEDVDLLFADFDIPSEEPQPETTVAASVEQLGDQPNASGETSDPFQENSFGESVFSGANDRSIGAQSEAAGAEPEVDMTPFSLADLGLNDDELAFFEQAQAERTQAEGTPAQPDATQPAEAAEADMTPFSLADLGLNDDELGFFEQAQGEQATEPVASQEPQNSSAEPESEPAPQVESPFSLADLEGGDVFDRVDQATVAVEASTGAAFEQPANTLAGDPPAVEAALPMELPEGAQPAASAAEEYHPVPVASTASQVASAAGGDELAAIHAMLSANPENDAMRLAVARMSQQTNDVGQAIEQYKQLIKRGNLLDEVVVDLQDSIADTDDPQMLRRLHRLLGDAYMKQNRFREAMDEYSWTLARSR